MKIQDPVCGMTIDTENAAARAEFRGETYYFCSIGCRERFEETPDRFVPVSQQREGEGGPHRRHL